ncbi:MAG: hypothetical protein CVU46_02580 [Chloroflexi bacterium HGW-Chloroflexi-8]|nr:MAG: hypothetical protein CVU46_02580 [Chloroflexi bacterium HGW-Chloroflexi-8]
MQNASIQMRLESFKTNIDELSLPKLLILLFVGSLLIHLAVVCVFINKPIALDDMFQYDMLARSIKEGNGFRWYAKADVEILRPYYSRFLDIDRLPFPDKGLVTTFRAPGYPLLLALLYVFVPESLRFIIARLVQAILAAMLALLTILLCQQIGFCKKVSILSAIGISFYPILLFYPIGLASENLYIPLSFFSVILILFSIKKNALRWSMLAGLFCGLTILTRSVFAVFTLFSGIWLIHFSPLKIKAGLSFLLIAFGICIPWSIRNSFIMKKPAFVENSLGYNMFIGYHPLGDGGFVSDIAIKPMNILDDGEREQFCMQQAIEFIHQDPVEAARRVFSRLLKFIGPEDREFFYLYSNNLIGAIPQPWLVLIYALLVIPWGFTLFYGAIGLWMTRDRKAVFLILIFLFAYGLPHLLIIAEPRFHLAWVPVLIPFAALAWDSRKEIRWKPSIDSKWMIITGIFILILFIFYGFLEIDFSKLCSVMKSGGNKLRFPY